jgi:hypothetical protein
MRKRSSVNAPISGRFSGLRLFNGYLHNIKTCAKVAIGTHTPFLSLNRGIP